jgi:hypothetical protein
VSARPAALRGVVLAAYVAVAAAAAFAMVSARDPLTMLVAIVSAALCARYVAHPRFFVFAAALVLAANQSTLPQLNSTLGQVRWGPLAYFCVLALGGTLLTGALPRKPSVVDLLCVSYLALVMLSAIWSIDSQASLARGGSEILMYVAVFWGIWTYVDRAGEERCVSALLWAGLAVQLASWALIVAGRNPFWAGRFYGLLENPNALGWVTAFSLPLALHRALARGRTADWGLVALMSASLVLTGSRGALLATGAAGAWLLWHARSRIFWWLAAVSLWVALSFADVTPMPASFQEYVRVEHLATGSGRTEAWAVGAALVAARPVLGYGFGTEELHLSKDLYDFQEFEGGYFHNSFLGLALQVGILGSAMLFVPLLMLAFNRVRAGFRYRGLDLEHALTGVLFAGLLACLFESWIYSMGSAMAYPFWVPVMLLARRARGGAPEPAAAADAQPEPEPAPSARLPRFGTAGAI